MAVYVDLECNLCGAQRFDQWSDQVGTTCTCSGVLERLYTLTRGPAPGTHASEKVVLYKSDREGGKIQYPGRGDVPVPKRLRQRGYEKIELNVRDLGAFERKHGVANERRHFDRNGKGF